VYFSPYMYSDKLAAALLIDEAEQRDSGRPENTRINSEFIMRTVTGTSDHNRRLGRRPEAGLSSFEPEKINIEPPKPPRGTLMKALLNRQVEQLESAYNRRELELSRAGHDRSPAGQKGGTRADIARFERFLPDPGSGRKAANRGSSRAHERESNSSKLRAWSSDEEVGTPNVGPPPSSSIRHPASSSVRPKRAAAASIRPSSAAAAAVTPLMGGKPRNAPPVTLVRKSAAIQKSRQQKCSQAPIWISDSPCRGRSMCAEDLSGGAGGGPGGHPRSGDESRTPSPCMPAGMPASMDAQMHQDRELKERDRGRSEKICRVWVRDPTMRRSADEDGRWRHNDSSPERSDGRERHAQQLARERSGGSPCETGRRKPVGGACVAVPATRRPAALKVLAKGESSIKRKRQSGNGGLAGSSGGGGGGAGAAEAKRRNSGMAARHDDGVEKGRRKGGQTEREEEKEARGVTARAKATNGVVRKRPEKKPLGKMRSRSVTSSVMSVPDSESEKRQRRG